MQKPLWPAHLHVKGASATHHVTEPEAETVEATHARLPAAEPPTAPGPQGHPVPKKEYRRAENRLDPQEDEAVQPGHRSPGTNGIGARLSDLARGKPLGRVYQFKG